MGRKDKRAASGDTVALDRMRVALETLTRIEHRVFVLHAQDELDYASIGQQLGLEIREVRHHLARALVHLANALDGPLS